MSVLRLRELQLRKRRDVRLRQRPQRQRQRRKHLVMRTTVEILLLRMFSMMRMEM